MKESFRGGISRLVAANGIAEHFRSPRKSMRYALRVASAIAMVALMATSIGMLLKRRGRVIDIPPHVFRTTNTAGDESIEPRLRRSAPTGCEDRDAGVTEASRQFAIEFVTPSLKQPESSEFPPDGIRFERLDLLNRVTDGKIEHWLVDGVVDSPNDYGFMVRSHWRIVLGRDDDSFFPIIAALEGFAIFHLRSHSDLLREARESALQKRQAEAAAKKAQELADRSEVWQAINAAKPAEEKAQAALKLALGLLAVGKQEAAYRRLQELIEKFPDTDTATEAQDLLKK